MAATRCCCCCCAESQQTKKKDRKTTGIVLRTLLQATLTVAIKLIGDTILATNPDVFTGQWPYFGS